MSNIDKSSKSFIAEAAIISVSNFAVKLVGVLFKIPLANQLGEFMGVFNAAYSIYAMLFMISTSGLPVAVSRLVAIAKEKGRRAEASQIFRTCALTFGAIGFICSLIMFIGADYICEITAHPGAELPMRVISPTLFIICITASIRGYFQGLRKMVPTAVSNFIEAVLKLILGLGGAAFAASRGWSGPVQAAFAVSGISIGVIVGTVYLAITFYLSRNSNIPDTDRTVSPRSAIAKNALRVAVPVTLAGSALYFSTFFDTVVINNRLIFSGFSEEMADRLYTAYTTLAISISDLVPSTLVYPIALSILPAMSAALAGERQREVRGYIHSSIRISGIIAIPSAFGLAVLARPVIQMIYFGSLSKEITLLDGSTVMPIDVGAASLAILSAGIVFLSLMSTTNALLHSYGKNFLPVVSITVGIVLLIVSETLLIGIPSIGIYGAPIASLICYSAATVLNMRAVRKVSGMRLNPIKLFGKPVICSALCAVAAFGGYSLSKLFVSEATRVGNVVMFIFGVIPGVAVYVISMLAFKGISATEVRLLPFGHIIAAVLIRLGLLKESKA